MNTVLVRPVLSGIFLCRRSIQPLSETATKTKRQKKRRKKKNSTTIENTSVGGKFPVGAWNIFWLQKRQNVIADAKQGRNPRGWQHMYFCILSRDLGVVAGGRWRCPRGSLGNRRRIRRRMRLQGVSSAYSDSQDWLAHRRCSRNFQRHLRGERTFNQ